MDDPEGNLGAYNSEESAKRAVYDFLEVVTKGVLRFQCDEQVEVNVIGDIRWHYVVERRTPSLIEVTVDWEGHYMMVRYEKMRVRPYV